MGPNTASGHGSVLYVTECQINYALRAMKPILRTLWAKRSVLPTFGPVADVVKVKADSEQADINNVQEKAKVLVWASGCTSWAIDPVSKRNVTMYPDFQYKYWLRSLFVSWKDFEVVKPKALSGSVRAQTFQSRSWYGLLVITGLALATHRVLN